MTTKLTLSIDKSSIERAKNYAKKTQRSLSEIVQHYFDNLTILDKDKDISEKLNLISGIAKVPENYTDEDLDNDKREYLENKYL